MREYIGAAAGLALLATIGTALVSCSEYADMPGPTKHQAGRTKNALATVVTGLIAQKLYGNATVDVAMEKQFYPDARITGQVTPNSIDTYIGLALTSARFTATSTEDGLEGEVAKSELNWDVKQTGPNSYDFTRFAIKFNSSLDLKLKDGVISGVYDRSGPNFDWYINGSYDEDGNIEVEVDGHWCLAFILRGKVTPQDKEPQPSLVGTE